MIGRRTVIGRSIAVVAVVVLSCIVKTHWQKEIAMNENKPKVGKVLLGGIIMVVAVAVVLITLRGLAG